MRYTSLLNKRLLCFLLTGTFVSFTILGQPDLSGKAKTGKSLTDMNIAPFGIVRSWYKIADPLGKTTGYKEFNANSSTDSSDIGILWWDARDIQRIEVVYDAKVPADQTGLPIIQYWQQSWPETPPRMPTKEDLEDDVWQGGWVTAATDVKSEGNTDVYTFKPLAASENRNAGYLPGSVTYRRTLLSAESLYLSCITWSRKSLMINAIPAIIKRVKKTNFLLSRVFFIMVNATGMELSQCTAYSQDCFHVRRDRRF